MPRPLLLALLVASCSHASSQVGVGVGVGVDAAPTPSPGTSPAASSIDAAPSTEGGFNPVAWTMADTAHRGFILYVPTPQKVVDKMLQVAGLRTGDVLYNLGCGDGRIMVTAALQYGIKAAGFDIDPQRVAEARDNIVRAGVDSLVTVERADIFTVDLTPATVVTMYLSPRLNVRLRPQLEKLAPGTRIVSHDYDIAGVEADAWWTITAPFFGRRNELWEAGVPEDDPRYPPTEHRVFLWVAPLKWT